MSWIDNNSSIIPPWPIGGNIYTGNTYLLNQQNRTLIQGFLDISGGNIILRNGGLFTQTDISCNRNIYGANCYIKSNIAIGKTTAGYTLDVSGIINGTALYVGGAPYIGSQWTTTSANIYYNTGNVAIGKTTDALYTLDVNGIINGTALYVGGAPYIGSQWTTTSANIYYNTGNVAIGKSTNPLFTLDVNGNINATGKITGTGTIFTSGNITAGSTGFSTSGPITTTGTLGCAAITCTSIAGTGTIFTSGNITAGSTGFSTSGPITTTGSVSCVGLTTTGAITASSNTIGCGAITCTTINATGIATYSNGNIVATGIISASSFNATSDYRIKANIIPINASIYTIDNLKPVSYIKNNNNQEFGFIAHEVQEQFPFLVSGEKDAIDPETNKPVYQSLNYQAIIPILVAEVKELKQTIKIQQQQINTFLQYIENNAV